VSAGSSTTQQHTSALPDCVPVSLRRAVETLGEPAPSVLVFASQSGEVKVHVEQPAAALQVPDPLPHRGHQLPVERVHSLEILRGRDVESDGRASGKPNLAVVLVAPIDGHLVSIATDSAPEPQTGSIPQVTDVQMVCPMQP
jgi:hypothetical protein